MDCSACGTDNLPTRKFCRACGAPLAPVCPACATRNEAGDRFCGNCGAQLASPGAAAPPGSPAAPPAPASSPEPAAVAYTPRHLAEQILTSRAALEGERKQVTVLFCDLVDSTGLAERLGPEAMHALLDRFFALAIAEVHRYEGTINQFLGDGFMALFGAPIAHEDHARRAALAALGLLREVQAEALAIRIGLNTGPVVVGSIGDNLRMDYTAVGDTTNLAARLQGLAEPGTALASEAVVRLLGGDVRAETLGPRSVKGKAQPVSVYRLLDASPRASLDALGQRLLSTFVGRERELEIILNLLAQARSGQGQVIGLVGEPGLGKSRLLYEVRQAVDSQHLDWLAGHCVAYARSIPYHPLVEVLRGRLSLEPNDDEATIRATVASSLRQVGLQPEQCAGYLLRLLGGGDEPELAAEQNPEVVKGATFDALRRLLLNVGPEPTILVVEDLHWIDQSSEEVLATLVESLTGVPLLLICSYRPGYRPPWIDRSYVTQLALRPLGRDESLSVVRSALRDAHVPETLARVVLERADGNPFFLEELTRAVGEQDGLLSEAAVPDTIQGVLMARIDRLPDGPKYLLQTASVLGREFSLPLLRAIWDDRISLEQHLGELKRLEFLFERPDATERTYVFKHALTQDVAYATLLIGRRRELHRRAALALEATAARPHPESHPLLAHHYWRAEVWDLAMEHARRAAEVARAAFANREALEHYTQALAAAERAGREKVELIALREARGQVHQLLGDFEAARADFEAALALAEQVGGAARGRLLGTLGMLWGGHKDYQRGLEYTEQSVAAAQAIGDLGALAEAQVRVGVMRLNLAQLPEARQSLESALANFRALDDEAGQARTLDVLALTTSLSGELAQTEVYGTEAANRLEALGDRATAASSRIIVGITRGFRGHREPAERGIRSGLDLMLVMGAPSGEAYARMALAQALEPFGAFELAWREASASLRIARELGHLEWQTGSLGYLGRVQRECGDVESALALHTEMLATARGLGTALWLAAALAEVGADLALAGETDQALARLDQAIQTAGGAIFFVAQARLARADLLLRVGRPADALQAAHEFYEIAPQFAVWGADVRRVEGEALAALGQPDQAEAALRQAKADALEIDAEPAHWRICLALGDLLARANRQAEATAEYAEALATLQPVEQSLSDPALRQCFSSSEPFRRARRGSQAGPASFHGSHTLAVGVEDSVGREG